MRALGVVGVTVFALLDLLQGSAMRRWVRRLLSLFAGLMAFGAVFLLTKQGASLDRAEHPLGWGELVFIAAFGALAIATAYPWSVGRHLDE